MLTEKPMAIALADARRMLDTAAATGRTLDISRTAITRVPSSSAVAWTTEIWARCARRASLLTWDRSPEYYSQSDWKGTWDKEGGGVIIDQAIHTLDLMRWFIGRPVGRTGQPGRTHPDIPVEDTAEGRVEFEGGAYGAFYVMNHYCTDEPVRLELACTRGKAVMEGPKARVGGTASPALRTTTQHRCLNTGTSSNIGAPAMSSRSVTFIEPAGACAHVCHRGGKRLFDTGNDLRPV